jgi:hypothetical protein
MKASVPLSSPSLLRNPSRAPVRLTGSLVLLSVAATAILLTARADDVTYDLSGVNLSTVLDPAPTEEIRVEISTDPDFAATVTTYAGTSGSSGMISGNRQSALFDTPTGVARDSEGNLFIADTVNHQICLLDTDGEVTTIAGSGFGFIDGDGDSARFRFPTAVAVGPNDNLYVADTFNHAIRKLTRPSTVAGTWTVTTLAGTGIAGFFDGSASTAKFSFPQGLTLDQTGNVYVADSGNHRIRLISTDSTVSTFAGTGTQGYGDGTTTDALFDHPEIPHSTRETSISPIVIITGYAGSISPVSTLTTPSRLSEKPTSTRLYPSWYSATTFTSRTREAR